MDYFDGDIIKVNDNYRLTVEQDTDAENPLDWGWGTEIQEIDNYRMWRGWDSPEEGVPFAARAAHRQVRRGNWTEEQRDRAIRLYMHVAGDDREFSVEEFRGYSQGDWATCLVLKSTDDGNVWDAYAQWRRGDVFTVTEEIRKVYVNPEDPQDLYEDWFEGDSVGGCFMDSIYTPEDVARENFEDYPICPECKIPDSVSQGDYKHMPDCTKREI